MKIHIKIMYFLNYSLFFYRFYEGFLNYLIKVINQSFIFIKIRKIFKGLLKFAIIYIIKFNY
jgi:hypothetical protein